MASIYGLPSELFLIIIGNENLGNVDISNVARSCRFLYAVVNPMLYRNVRDEVEVIYWAATRGIVGTMEKLLAAGADPNKHSMEKETPKTNATQALDQMQQYALSDYHLQLMLLEQSNGVRQEMEESVRRGYHAALHLAAKAGHDEVLDLLLNHGANINAMCKGLCNCQPIFPCGRPDGLVRARQLWTPLHLAMCHGRLSTTKLLMSRGASLMVCDWESSGQHYDPGITALHSASVVDNLAIIDAVLEHYLLDVNTPDGQGATALHWAFHRGKPDAMQLLIAKGANINSTDIHGRSLLLYACATKRNAEVHWLLQLGADPRLREHETLKTALHYICSTEYWENHSNPTHYDILSVDRLSLVKALLEAGADVNATSNPDGQVAIVAAASDCHFELIELLLDHGADINAHGLDDETALIASCRPNRWVPITEMRRCFGLLLDRGAAVHEKANLSNTALDVLCADQRRDNKDTVAMDDVLASMVKMLLERGLGLNSSSEDQGSYILRFFLKRYLACCSMLVKYGAQAPSNGELRKMIAHAIKCDDAGALEYVLSFKNAKKLMSTPARLFTALKGKANNVVAILLDNGAPHTHTAKDGLSCLHMACSHRCINVSFHRRLLETGADPNAMTTGGLTPLKAAIELGSLPLVELLLEYGAKPDLAGPTDLTPIELANASFNKDILLTLLRQTYGFLDDISNTALISSLQAEDIRSTAHAEVHLMAGAHNLNTSYNACSLRREQLQRQIDRIDGMIRQQELPPLVAHRKALIEHLHRLNEFDRAEQHQYQQQRMLQIALQQRQAEAASSATT